MFSCGECAEAEAHGDDLKGERSGSPRSCTGPRERTFHGEVRWRGCPRASLDARTAAWIDLYDRTGGRLTYREILRAPALLLDVYRVLDYAAALREREALKNATAQAQPRG